MICAGQNMTNSTLVNDTVTTFSQVVSGNSTTPVDCKWPEGFGLIAGELWFNWMGWWTNLFQDSYDKVATLSSGSIVNGLSMINFCMARVPFFKEDETTLHYKAATFLDKYIEGGKLNEGVDPDTVKQSRVLANPYSWRPCGNKQSDEEQSFLLDEKLVGTVRFR